MDSEDAEGDRGLDDVVAVDAAPAPASAPAGDGPDAAEAADVDPEGVESEPGTRVERRPDAGETVPVPTASSDGEQDSDVETSDDED